MLVSCGVPATFMLADHQFHVARESVPLDTDAFAMRALLVSLIRPAAMRRPTD